MFRANELTNLLYSDAISKMSSKIEQAPRYAKEIVGRYGHTIKHDLEYLTQPCGELFLGTMLILPTTLIGMCLGPNPADYYVKNVFPYLLISSLTGITLLAHGIKKGLL